jgi:molybdopterin converting factor small subunit
MGTPMYFRCINLIKTIYEKVNFANFEKGGVFLKVTVSCRPHFWEWFPRGDWCVELKDGATFRDLVEALALKLPPEFLVRMNELKQEKPPFVALVDGRSIKGLEDFDTPLKQGSQVTFTLMLGGG